MHFPIVLVFLLPLFAIGALWTIRRGSAIRRAWAIPAAFSVALALSAWAAVETGESQEDKVEDIVSGASLDRHEDAADLFLKLSGVLVLVTAAGFAPGAIGRSARIVAAVGAVGMVGVGANVGHSGGELVYAQGAASAYAKPDSTRTGGAVAPGQSMEETRRGQ
ncbi:MAG: hypothetical protein ABI311_03500 [Gemmatimonadaceae bacterium]